MTVPHGCLLLSLSAAGSPTETLPITWSHTMTTDPQKPRPRAARFLDALTHSGPGYDTSSPEPAAPAVSSPPPDQTLRDRIAVLREAITRVEDPAERAKSPIGMGLGWESAREVLRRMLHEEPTAATPPPADRAAMERVRAVLETEAVAGRNALEYRGLITSALMAAEAKPLDGRKTGTAFSPGEGVHGLDPYYGGAEAQQPDTETREATLSGRVAQLVADDARALRMDLYDDLATYARQTGNTGLQQAQIRDHLAEFLLEGLLRRAVAGERLRCPRCRTDITDYDEDDHVFRTGDDRPYCSGECVIAAHRKGLPTTPAVPVQPAADGSSEEAGA